MPAADTQARWPSLRQCGLAAVCAATAPSPCAAQIGEVSMLDGAITIEPMGLLQLDTGVPFARGSDEVPGGGANFRRARAGISGDLLADFEYVLEWDFGGRPGTHGGLYETSIAWTGIDGLSIRAGAFEPNLSLQLDRSASDLLFLERSAVVDVAKRITTDTARIALQARANGDRWFASAAITGGQVGDDYDGSERGAVLRVTGLPVRTDDLTIHTGVSIARSFRPTRGGGRDGARGFAFSTGPELSLDAEDPPLDTGALTARSGSAAGLEFALLWKRWQAQGEWYRIDTDRGRDARHFSGWYAQVSHVLVGGPREYQADSATLASPRAPDGGFDPAAGRWGTLEAGARFSTVDLNDRDVRGGRQQIWSTGLAWWPVQRFALQTQYQYVEISKLAEGDGSRFHTLSLRAQLNF